MRRSSGSRLESGCLETRQDVVRSLVTYVDWWQPSTTSVITAGPARRSRAAGDGMSPGLLDTLDARTELCRRMRFVGERDRRLLFLWYVKEAPVDEIARDLGVSRRQCFRRRNTAIQRIVDLERPEEAA